MTLLLFFVVVLIIMSLFKKKVDIRCFTAHIMTKIIAIIWSESDRICSNERQPILSSY